MTPRPAQVLCHCNKRPYVVGRNCSLTSAKHRSPSFSVGEACSGYVTWKLSICPFILCEKGVHQLRIFFQDSCTLTCQKQHQRSTKCGAFGSLSICLILNKSIIHVCLCVRSMTT